MKCLLLQTNDNKKLFTYQKNYKHLLEYIKTFNAKVFIVKIDKDQQILDLNKLVSALCDKNFKVREINFEIIQEKNIKIEKK